MCASQTVILNVMFGVLLQTISPSNQQKNVIFEGNATEQENATFPSNVTENVTLPSLSVTVSQDHQPVTNGQFSYETYFIVYIASLAGILILQLVKSFLGAKVHSYVYLLYTDHTL